jgi:peptidoglycan hydrolase CwlO-like protein
MSLNIAERLHSRRGSVASIKSVPIAHPRERSNSISSVILEPKEQPKQKQVTIEEPIKEKKGLKSLQNIVDSLSAKLSQFEQQFKKDNDKITLQEKEISKLKDTIRDILDG